MDKQLDALFISPDSSSKAYQDLSKVYSAIEPPTWALLLAESCRKLGFGVGILDCDAERLSLDTAVARIREANPRLIVFVVYGQNPNSGTTSMIGAVSLAKEVTKELPDIPICFVGSHTSALPREVLANPSVDIVLFNEGVYALHNLLRSDLDKDLPKIRGIGYKTSESGEIRLHLNAPERLVAQNEIDYVLPGYAWDLLPYIEKPLDLYRSHFWHADFDHEKRSPFAAIYTSLGCNFACDFCMINIINRQDSGDDVSAADSKGMRFWSPEWVIRQMESLQCLGVQTLRISDEMFFLNRRYYQPILEQIREREFDFSMWAYSRIDTIRPSALKLFKQAGVNWLALGVEAGNPNVRREIAKGSFKDINIRDVRTQIGDADINIISNYIVGFPDDTPETMNQTLDLALELNTEMANIYPCQALPGSPMHLEAQRKGWKLPESYEGYAFLSYDCEPLPTSTVSAAEVLKFRDEAWQTYFTNPEYLQLIEGRFGIKQRKNIEDMTKIRLKRRILGD